MYLLAMKLFFVRNDHVSLYTMKPFRIQKTIVLRSFKLGIHKLGKLGRVGGALL